MPVTPEQLVREALEAMHFAYVPYSGFTAVSYTHLTLPTKA